MKNALTSLIADALRALGIEQAEDIEIEVPKNESHGDLSSPVAMGLARTLKKAPRAIAQEIIAHLPAHEAIESISIAGPGFINFTLKPEFIHASLRSLLREGGSFFRTDIGKGRRIQIEFVSANPTGPLHVGHGRGAAIGGALSNLLEAAGYNVTKEYYVNDAGSQIHALGESIFARYKEMLGIAYPIPENGYKGDYVKEIAQAALKMKGDAYKNVPYDEAREYFIDLGLNMMLKEIKTDLQGFGIEFNTWQSEVDLHKSKAVEHAIEFLRARELIYEHEGALWFKATSLGDDKDRVIIKSDGTHTYFASDIAYHLKKIEAGFDELINIWGADHHGYVPRLEAVIDALGYERSRLTVLLVQMVSLEREGKPVQMSKRAGEFVTLKEVIDEVGADTTKFIFLTRRHDSHLKFDLDAAKAESSENPVYYVQYANARINSIFSHARASGIPTDGLDGAALDLLVEADEVRLMKKVLNYSLVFEAAARAREPHRITFYLQELAGTFHPYYNRHRVITEDTRLSQARLALCEAVRLAIKDGLVTLGLSAPKRM